MLGQDAWSKYEKNIAKDKLKEKSDFVKEKVQELSKISVRPDSLNRHINYYVRHPNETLDDPNAGRRGGANRRCNCDGYRMIINSVFTTGPTCGHYSRRKNKHPK